jgi:hypothetical protein
MDATPWVAWIGAITGVASFGWNVYIRLSSGPKLRVSAWPGMVVAPPPPANPKFLRITIRNTGNAPTTLNNIGFHLYRSRWAKRRLRAVRSFVLATYKGPQFPYKIEVGGEWTGLMQQDERFDQMLASGRLWCAVYHSFSAKPVQVRVLDLDR